MPNAFALFAEVGSVAKITVVTTESILSVFMNALIIIYIICGAVVSVIAVVTVRYPLICTDSSPARILRALIAVVAEVRIATVGINAPPTGANLIRTGIAVVTTHHAGISDFALLRFQATEWIFAGGAVKKIVPALPRSVADVPQRAGQAVIARRAQAAPTTIRLATARRGSVAGAVIALFVKFIQIPIAAGGLASSRRVARGRIPDHHNSMTAIAPVADLNTERDGGGGFP